VTNNLHLFKYTGDLRQFKSLLGMSIIANIHTLIPARDKRSEGTKEAIRLYSFVLVNNLATTLEQLE
jgi:hypothetical protein